MTEVLKKITTGPDDRYIVEIDVGGLPRHRAQEYLRNVADKFKGFFPENSVLYVPMRGGVPSMKVSVLSKV